MEKPPSSPAKKPPQILFRLNPWLLSMMGEEEAESEESGNVDGNGDMGENSELDGNGNNGSNDSNVESSRNQQILICSKCRDSGFKLFENMGQKNVMTWTAMILGLAVHGKGKQALKLFDDMTESGILPNAVTFTSLLFACSQAGLIEEGLTLFHKMKSKFRIVPLSHHFGCVVDLLGRAGHLDEAYEFFVSEKVENDEVLWRSLLHACRVHNDIVMGKNVAKILMSIQPEMNLETYDNCEVYAALSNICASAGRWEDVAAIREVMNDKWMQNVPAISTVFA